MNEYTRIEMAVGLFVLLGLSGLAYLSVSIGGANFFPTDRIAISARFASVGDLSEGAVVKLAGVPVGQVTGIGIDKYAARVDMDVERSLELPTDTIASIKTAGLLGEAYVSLSPGADLANIQDGGRIKQTEPPLDLFELVEKYAFESGDESGDKGADKPASATTAPGAAAQPDDGGVAPGAEAPSKSPFPDPLE